jgi:imidazolonepropionase-like amidohydrolase
MTTRLSIPVAGIALVASASLVSCTMSNVPRFLSDLPVNAPIVALANVRVIDGTGMPGKNDQTIVIESGLIAAIGPSPEVRVPAGAKTLDLRGRTVMPGLVGMHDHLFYHAGGSDRVVTPRESFAMLYLAAGVTTIRTGGSVDLAGDLRLKRLIDEGKRPGPAIHVTSPYLHAQTPEPDPARVARDVGAWADQGATSFKAYMSLRRDELKAAIETAHARGLKVTGHLCAVGFQEAARLGIDNLEHGLLQDSEFTAGKQPDQCPDSSQTLATVLSMNVAGPSIQRTIAAMIQHGVALTSTLAVFESFASRARLDERTLQVLAPRALERYREIQAQLNDENQTARWWNELLRKEMAFERAFFAAGGRLVAGVDPTGWGGVVAGFGNQRQLELLVEAGLTPEVAIRVATANGAALLDDTTIGSLAPGMQADLVVVRGNPSANISDIRNVEIVFRKGIGYNPDALIAAAAGTVGALDFLRILRWPYGPLIVVVTLILVARRVMKKRITNH